MERVTSADGTQIAYERTGNGPPLILVHGSLNDYRAWSFVRPAFAERFTVYAMDRRGRGESGTPAEHALERQFEDVLAVMDAAGAPVDLIGHSYGAHVALGAAALAPERVKHLVLYEPPTPDPNRQDIGEAFATRPAEEALTAFAQLIGMTADEVAESKQTQVWAYLLSFTASMPSEARALVNHGFEPAQYSSLKMPALFLQGSRTSETLGEVMRLLHPHMPQAVWHTFEDEGHGAQMRSAQAFSDVVLAFLGR